MTRAALALLALLAPFTLQATRMDPEPLSRYRWTHRLLIVHIPDTASGRTTLDAFRGALDTRMEDVRDRDLLIVPVGDLPRVGPAREPWVDLAASERLAVRRQLPLAEQSAALVLIGKDGGVKARQPEGAFDLDALLSLIDGMPMRRAELKKP